jgi:hypothetical protein
MGIQWWLIGVAVWVVLVVSCYREIRHPHVNPDACTECGHEAGLNGPHCSEVEDNNGLSSTRCGCQSSYHLDYESAAV